MNLHLYDLRSLHTCKASSLATSFPDSRLGEINVEKVCYLLHASI